MGSSCSRPISVTSTSRMQLYATPTARSEGSGEGSSYDDRITTAVSIAPTVFTSVMRFR
jgi:hypothetical protein